MIWVISDMHFRHERMYEFIRRDGSNLRVRHQFANAKEGDAAMVRYWNDTVHDPKDKIYVLGDAVLGVKSDDDLRIMHECRGYKILIPGNHDHPHRANYLSVFTQIHGSYHLDDAWLTHMPMHPQSLGQRINIHGHTHERTIDDPRYVNVCVEQIGYAPIPLSRARAMGRVGGV